MIGSIVFLILLGSVIFKMVYDHQMFKDMEKIKLYQNDTDGDQDIH